MRPMSCISLPHAPSISVMLADTSRTRLCSVCTSMSKSPLAWLRPPVRAPTHDCLPTLICLHSHLEMNIYDVCDEIPHAVTAVA